MTDLIEKALLVALENTRGVKPESNRITWIVYDSDIPKLVKDIRSGLAGEQLPPSLAAKPNIAWEDQTLDQLYGARDYWTGKVCEATRWGGDLRAARDFRDGCNVWISKREREKGRWVWPPKTCP